MPCIEDWVSHPLNVIDGIRKESGTSTKEKVHEFFAHRIQDGSHRIPSINDTPVEKLRPNSLVKFRCMVQDMFGPEYYLSEYEIVSKTSGKSEMRNGMFRDMADCPQGYDANFESTRNVTAEKHSFFCVSIPGETEWAKKGFARKSAHHETRAPQTGQSNKRGLDLDDEEMEDQGKSIVEEGMEITKQEGQNKKPKVDNEVTQDTSMDAMSSSLNHPVPGEKGPSCIVHVYDTCEDIKLNDIIEFVGVVSVQPRLAAFTEEKSEDSNAMALTADTFMSEEEHAAHYPPTSLVPRLHCVSFHHLKHSNPCIPMDIDGSTESLLEVVRAREDILSMFKGLLHGDALAAEYLLLHLVSSVYTRCGVMAVGKFTLNLCGCPTDSSFTKQLLDTLKSIVPKCVNLPMTLNNMNTMKFVPKKDYNANRLTSGILQLSDSTQLILDETALEAGQLNTAGVQNVTALGTLISWQKLEYDFHFYKTDFKTNLQVLVLSEGKSMLPCDCHVKLEASSSQQESPGNISEELLNLFRTYLGLVRLSSYSITPDMQQAIQEDFVQARQRNPSRMSADDFHLHLLVARLMALSSGKGTLTQDLWEKVKNLEEQRKARLLMP